MGRDFEALRRRAATKKIRALRREALRKEKERRSSAGHHESLPWLFDPCAPRNRDSRTRTVPYLGESENGNYRFLADENLKTHTLDILIDAGFEIISVHSLWPRASDSWIFEVSKYNEIPLITHDRGFGNFHKYELAQSPGVVILPGRFPYDPLHAMTPQLHAALQHFLHGALEAAPNLCGMVIRYSPTGLRWVHMAIPDASPDSPNRSWLVGRDVYFTRLTPQ